MLSQILDLVDSIRFALSFDIIYENINTVISETDRVEVGEKNFVDYGKNLQYTELFLILVHLMRIEFNKYIEINYGALKSKKSIDTPVFR